LSFIRRLSDHSAEPEYLTVVAQAFAEILNADEPIGHSGHALPQQQAYSIVRNWAFCSGVARLAETTGLDRLCLPNYYAVRPAARHRSAIVSGGKGLTQGAAVLSALYECFERWAAEEYPGEVIHASLKRLKKEFAGVKLAFPSDLEESIELSWAFGFDLISQQPCLLPLRKVIFPDLPGAIDVRRSQMTNNTNGLGAAGSPLEAICIGVLELIERDAVARIDANEPTLIDTATIPDQLSDLIRIFEEKAIELSIVRCLSPTQVPVYYALSADEYLGLPFLFCSGSSANPNAAEALLGTLTEVSQSRAAYISTLRDDVGIRMSAFDGFSYAARRFALKHWFSKSNLSPFAIDGEFRPRSFGEMLSKLIERIARAWPSPILACAKLRTFPGLFAFRLYCPQMYEPLQASPE
jgi:YcaO-like protein with predicted kinase domain